MADIGPDANPLLEAWTGPFEAPPFDRIAPRGYGDTLLNPPSPGFGSCFSGANRGR